MVNSYISSHGKVRICSVEIIKTWPRLGIFMNLGMTRCPLGRNNSNTVPNNTYGQIARVPSYITFLWSRVLKYMLQMLKFKRYNV